MNRNPRSSVLAPLGEMLVDEKNAGVAIVERERDLGRAAAGVDRIQRAAAPPDTEHVFEIAIRVESDQRDAIAVAHAEIAQRGGEAGSAFGKFAPGAPAVAEDGRDRGGIAAELSMNSVHKLKLHTFLPGAPASPFVPGASLRPAVNPIC